MGNSFTKALVYRAYSQQAELSFRYLCSLWWNRESAVYIQNIMDTEASFTNLHTFFV